MTFKIKIEIKQNYCVLFQSVAHRNKLINDTSVNIRIFSAGGIGGAESTLDSLFTHGQSVN